MSLDAGFYIDPVTVSSAADQALTESVELRRAWQAQQWTVSAISPSAAGNTAAAQMFLASATTAADAADTEIAALSDGIESASEALHACAVSLSDQDEQVAAQMRQP